MTFLYHLNELELWGTDVGNVYLEATTFPLSLVTLMNTYWYSSQHFMA
jgi:hypothetical protein